jgi:hypothetical protein
VDPWAVQYHGPYRYFAQRPKELAAALALEAHRAWAGLPSVPLEEWARATVESIERQPYSPTSADAFEFYLPANCRAGTPQFRRWRENAANATSILLARRARLYGAREYRLVDVQSGRIVGACDLQDIDVRRLMYALDLAANNPVRARRARIGSRSEWLFTSELPRAEQRTLAALGTLEIPNDRPFERRWTILRNEELALEMLRSLGIALG